MIDKAISDIGCRRSLESQVRSFSASACLRTPNKEEVHIGNVWKQSVQFEWEMPQRPLLFPHPDKIQTLPKIDRDRQTQASFYV